ncbi:hypothetical protein ATCVMN08101_371R [Acanthocystis turfacea Chlorella virus MN0810.1]|nr:hypothetical protein ATCVMN08101_371R [Acanthocystis turfacea Chlorella virus MN0810.1]
MWLFFLALAILLVYKYRSVVKKAAKNLKIRGVEIPLLEPFAKQYPTYYKNAEERVKAFNAAYQKTFDYSNISIGTLNTLFSIRDDVLYNISEIKLRLPNDLDMERDLTAAYEQADRRLMEYITDAKTRFNINIYPGQTSSAFAARNYRAANDIVL